MAPKKQQTSINQYLQKQEQQPNLIEQTSQQGKEQQSQESFEQSIQQKISNIHYDQKQQRQKKEKLENVLDKLMEQLNLQFTSIDEQLNKIQSQIVIKLEQIAKQFNEVPQFYQFYLQNFQYKIQQLQEQQEQQKMVAQKFQDQQSSIPMEIESENNNEIRIRFISIEERLDASYVKRTMGGKDAERRMKSKEIIRNKYQTNFSASDQQIKDQYIEEILQLQILAQNNK